MFKIVPFESSRAQKSRDFGLEDLSDDSFEISGADVAILRTSHEGDWSNQELASIYLVVRLLKGAGVEVETDRGLTDDGSPWCVFCNANGDVVVHMARIDGAYVLDGVGLDNPLTGKTVEALIDRFVSGAAEKATSEKQARLSAVLDLSKHRQNKVFIHPAAQLFALIWAAMLLKDVAPANATEADGATFSDELDIPRADVVTVDLPDSRLAVPQSALETSEYNSSDVFAKSRDSFTSGLQSAGLLSLGYFLVGYKHMSLGVVFDWLRMEAEVNVEENAAVAGASEAPDVFLEMLDALAALTTAILHDSTRPDDSAANGNHLTAVGDTGAVAHLVVPPDQMLEMGLSVEHPIDIPVFSTLKQVLHVRVEMPQDVPQAVTPPATTNELEEPYTIDDLFSYLADFDVNSLEGNETFLEDLLILEQDGQASSPDASIETGVDAPIETGVDAPIETGVDAPIETGVDAPIKTGAVAPIKTDVVAPIETGVVITDADVIAAIIDFLGTSEDMVTLYYEEGVHIIEHQGTQIEGASDALALSWTFTDGSQIMIVGTATDLLPLDLLF